MSLRATVEVSVLTASTSHCKLATEVSNAYASATSITMDAESGNRIDGSTFHVTLDQVSIHFNTGAESSVSTGDSSALATGKNRTSTLGLPDQDVKSYEARKYSVQPLSDQTGLSTHRPDSDVYTLADIPTNHLNKNQPDTTSVSDIFSRENRFARILSSTFTLDDWNTVAGEEDVEKNYQGDKSNVFGFADQLSASSQKVLQSTSTVISSAAIHPTKTESDTTTVSDTQSTVWDIGRIPESTLAFDDALVAQYEIEKSSSCGVTDEFLLARGKLFGFWEGVEYSDEKFEVSDSSSYSIQKDELETTNVQDVVGLAVSHSNLENVGIGDGHTMSQSLRVPESLALQERFILSLIPQPRSAVLGASTVGQFYFNGGI